MKFRRTFKVETVQNMSDDEMIARAAKEAFEIRDDPYDDDEWDDLDSSDKELYECQARAVLGAIGSVDNG